MHPLIVDALATGGGKRIATRDVIGAGPRSIAGVLEKAGYNPSVVSPGAVLEGKLDLSKYDSLFVSGMSSDLLAVKRVVSKWRVRSSMPVVLGGPVVSELERVLRKVDADLGVVGEGEVTLQELLDNGLSSGRVPSKDTLETIQGIIYVDDGVKINPLRPYSRRPLFDGFTPSTRVIKDYPLYKSSRVYVEAVRGCSNYHRALMPEGACIECGKCREGDLTERYYCPAGIPPGCGYCSVPSLYGPPRSRSPSILSKEISELIDLGVRRVVLSAPGFLDYGRDLLVEPEPLTDPRHPEPNYEYIESLMSQLHDIREISTGKASLLLENIKGYLVTERAAKLLGRYLKGSPVNVGFETGSASHSRLLGRPSTPRENLRAVRRLSDAGLKPYVYFIHGLPGQNRQTVVETINAINNVVDRGAKRIILYRFTPLPMSTFEDYPMAPPASKNRFSKRIYDAAYEANLRLKEDLLHRSVRVVIAEKYDRNPRFYVAYPLFHGPVVLVEGEYAAGTVVTVEIDKIVSSRMVQGRVLDVRF